MNKRWIEDFIFYWIVQGFRTLFGLLPYSWAVPLGASILYGVSFFYPRRFDIAYSNIKTAFDVNDEALGSVDFVFKFQRNE